MSRSGQPTLLPLRAPDEIESGSMRIIDSEIPEPRPYVGDEWLVVRRMIHASADFELLSLVRFSQGAVEAALTALASGPGLVVTDTEMARMGIPERRLAPLGYGVRCLMNDPRVVERAAREGITRATAAVDLALDELAPDIFVVGNAPTFLIRLIERLREGAPAPRLVIGMPVGFVNAAESKALLVTESPAPWIVIEGRKGGSPLAAAALNALAEIALHRRRAAGTGITNS